MTLNFEAYSKTLRPRLECFEAEDEREREQKLEAETSGSSDRVAKVAAKRRHICTKYQTTTARDQAACTPHSRVRMSAYPICENFLNHWHCCSQKF